MVALQAAPILRLAKMASTPFYFNMACIGKEITSTSSAARNCVAHHYSIVLWLHLVLVAVYEPRSLLPSSGSPSSRLAPRSRRNAATNRSASPARIATVVAPSITTAAMVYASHVSTSYISLAPLPPMPEGSLYLLVE